MTVEREIKLAADADVVLPDLTDILPGATVGPVTRLQLSAVYFDTPTLSLARWGITLRAWTGEPGPIWTLKVPAPPAESGLSRHELTFDEPSGPVPLAARQVVLAHIRSQPLNPVVRVDTDRTQFELEIGGRPVATVCDDLVVTDLGTEPGGTFREIEVELAPDIVSHKVTDLVTARLRAAGCHADEVSVPKAVRALGPRALDPPDVAISRIGKDANARELVRHAIAESVTQLISLHVGVWIDGNSADLRQMKVAARRLRSDLRIFAPLLDHGWTVWLPDELAWLAGEVRIARDAEVLAERLRSQVESLPAEDTSAAGRLLQRIGTSTVEARRQVLCALSSDRYVALLDALVNVTGDPSPPSESPGSADQLDRRMLVDLVRKLWRRLSRAVEALGPDFSDADLDKVRVPSERARYAAEAVAPFFGRDARRFASALADVQSVLSDYQDTLAAEAWIREAAKALPAGRLAAGELVAYERHDRERLRHEFTTVWERVSRPKLRSWMEQR